MAYDHTQAERTAKEFALFKETVGQQVLELTERLQELDKQITRLKTYELPMRKPIPVPRKPAVLRTPGVRSWQEETVR